MRSILELALATNVTVRCAIDRARVAPWVSLAAPEVGELHAYGWADFFALVEEDAGDLPASIAFLLEVLWVLEGALSCFVLGALACALELGAGFGAFARGT